MKPNALPGSVFWDICFKYHNAFTDIEVIYRTKRYLAIKIFAAAFAAEQNLLQRFKCLCEKKNKTL